MPVNAGAEYFVAERKFHAAKTKEERIAALEEMIRTLPKHKSSEHQLAQLRKRMAKLKADKTTKSTAKPKFSIRKEGAAQVCMLGLTQSGKSSLLNSLTNVKAEVGTHEFTTTVPTVGMMKYGDVNIQMVEIPSTFGNDEMNIAQNSDLILTLVDATKDIKTQVGELQKVLKKYRLLGKKKMIVMSKDDNRNFVEKFSVSANTGEGLENLKQKIWLELGLIRVYTKSPNKEKDVPPVVLEPGATVKEVVKNIHKDFLKNFKFARLFNDTSFSGIKVGLDYRLKDLDVIEIHA
ncbi:TGS domain-containing protein [archaeon]|nr:MAG: TGS domain-containing protein [archaeon]